MVKALTSPQKESFLLLTLQYGDPAAPTFAYYTNRSEDWAGQFVSTPALDIELPKNNGAFDEAVCNMKIPSDAFVDRFTDGLPTSPCSVVVQEVTLPIVIGESASVLVLFTGKVTSTIRNKDGRANARLIKAKSWKSFFKTRMGMPADHQCPFVFNQIGCDSGTFAGGAPVAVGTHAGTIATIDGHKITFTSAPSHSRDNFFNKGYISYGGINIDIREYDASIDDNAFYLTRQPPTDWIGKTVDIFPGCDKTIENCRDWDNEQNFGGVGFGIPAYNPLFEDSP